MLLQGRRRCLAGLGVACRLYITFTAKKKPASLKQTLLFPAGLMLRGFDFRLSSKIQKIYSPFLTSPFLSLFLLISRTFWSKSQGMELFPFLTGMEEKNYLEISSVFSHWPVAFHWPCCFVYQSKMGNKAKKCKAQSSTDHHIGHTLTSTHRNTYWGVPAGQKR